MRAVDAVRSGFKQYVAFSGRSSQSEFWWFWLFSWLAWLTAGVADFVLWKATGSQAFFPITVTDFATPHEQIRVYAVNDGLLAWLTQLALVIPLLAVAVRRLHDTDRSGWWTLLVVVPVLGWIVLVVWYCRRGTTGSNRFGPDTRTAGLAA